jgi:hypothetical protein
MSFLALANDPAAFDGRRSFLGKSGILLSGAAVALLAGQDALAAKDGKSTASDVRILNSALGAELEAIAAYQLGAESGLLQKPVQHNHETGRQAGRSENEVYLPNGYAEKPGRRAALCSVARKGCGECLSGRSTFIRQFRPREGCGEHPW